MKVLFCASEVFPFAKTGGLADVASSLPLALEKLGVRVKIAMPRYKNICFADDRTVIGKNIEVYFIGADKYFNRDCLYGTAQASYPDNLERFSFFCREALRRIKEAGFCPDVIHLHDWQTALVALYLKTGLQKETFYEKIKTVFTIHNLAYQGVFPREEFAATGLPSGFFREDALEWKGKINLLKGALLFSDLLTTVSPAYSREIQTKTYGEGLESVLRRREKSLFGIINGIDYQLWSPETDKALPWRFSRKNLRGKRINKSALQREAGLAENEDIPLLASIGRLAYQKGADLIVEALPELMKQDVQFILLGAGEERYERLFGEISRRYPGKASIHLKYDEELARKIYAGSDIFLMPSRYEPCGLGQLIALRYGGIPVVRLTGGLKDTVVDYSGNKPQGYGFTFLPYSKTAFLESLGRALEVYRNKAEWQMLVKRAMGKEFSWLNSARKYLEFYQKLTR